MSDSRRAFDFSPFPRVLCINTSNVNNFKMLALSRGESISITEPRLRELPNNGQSCPAASPCPAHRAAPAPAPAPPRGSAGPPTAPRWSPRADWLARRGTAGPLRQVTPQLPREFGESHYVSATQEPRVLNPRTVIAAFANPFLPL